VSFDVGADAYLRFMGRFSEPLAVSFADLAAPGHDGRVLDVGCGPGALTAELVRRQGTARVSAVDPSQSFVSAVRDRLPGVDARLAVAEALPFPDGCFSAALAQLVVHFMTDPVAGLREMGRVVAPGGTVAACVWDFGGGRAPLSLFWQAARELDSSAPGESGLAGVSEGHLAALFTQAGLVPVQEGDLTVTARYESFEDWWGTFLLGVGPAGAYVAGLGESARAALREHCRNRLPAGRIEIRAAAWTAICPGRG
jgi:SAM-dependent methyltransferase